MKKKPKIYYSHPNQYKNQKTITKERYRLLSIAIVAIMAILSCNLFLVQILKHDEYTNRVLTLSQNVIEGSSAPRGRIYDRNHRLVVDNKPVKSIYYKKQSGTSKKEEVEIAYQLASMIEVDHSKLYEINLKEFWLQNYPEEGNEKITEEEWRALETRKLSSSDIENLKLERITEEELSEYQEIDLEAAYIYYLMNKGYSYSEKTIKNKDVTDEEYALVSENVGVLRGVNTRLDWERYYPYGDVFRTILGNVSTSESGIPKELKDYYIARGYTLDDRVGTSYLEYQYEDYLRGVKDQFLVNKNGENILIKEGSRGNDIVLTIDIELQKEVERILVEEITKAKSEPNTEYYNHSFVIITDPKTGEVLAMAGKQVVKTSDGYEVYDYTPGITTSPVTVGSVVKGASHIVGYNTGALTIGEIRDDACIKIASTPEKCSYKYWGVINDIQALKYSSNTYQFRTAIKVGKGNYVYDAPLKIDESAFDIYRNTFAEFGLGVKTGIDLPVESLGYKGSSTLAGHLLDFSIGQYDTYTPIQLSQYISTIANNGDRMQPYLLKAVYEPTKEPLTNLIYETKPVLLNHVNTEDRYLERVKQGFIEVLKTGGTGSGSIDLSYQPAGKTGTSQSFLDTDNDGKIDTETITTTFVAFAPVDDPIVTFTVISPDVSHYGNKSSYQTYVNKRISKEVSKKFFEIYQ